MTIKLEFNMPDNFFADILCTAVEGGINYWAKWSEVLYDDQHYVSAMIRPQGHPYNEEHRNDYQRVDYAAIERGIQLIVGANPKVVNSAIGNAIYHAVTESDAGQIDADAADVIIQLAMFGEIVFG